MTGKFAIREARARDIPTLVALRRELFAAMGYREPELLSQVANASARYFATALPRGEFRAWVAEVDGEVVGCGGLVIHTVPPTPRNLAGKEGYIMNMFTRPKWRRRGIGTAILSCILDQLRREDIPLASLHATLDGRPIYKRAGFTESNEMRLHLAALGREE